MQNMQTILILMMIYAVANTAINHLEQMSSRSRRSKEN